MVAHCFGPMTLLQASGKVWFRAKYLLANKRSCWTSEQVKAGKNTIEFMLYMYKLPHDMIWCPCPFALAVPGMWEPCQKDVPVHMWLMWHLSGAELVPLCDNFLNVVQRLCSRFLTLAIVSDQSVDVFDQLTVRHGQQ